MHPELSSSHKKLVLYYGSHSGGTETIRALMSSQHDDGYYGPFEHMNISVPFTQCESIHSPSLFVDNDIQKLYM
jgi:hypothetical protein